MEDATIPRAVLRWEPVELDASNELMRCKGRVSETEKAASSEMLCDQKAQRGYTIGVTVGECCSLISWLLTSDRAAPQLAECEAGI